MTPFLDRGREIIDATAAQLEAAIPGARRGNRSRLPGYEAVYVHFRDAELPQSLALWLFAAESGTPNSVPGARDSVGVGIKHDADEELDAGAWRFRRLTPFAWREHVDAQFAGFRWLLPADDLDEDPAAAATAIAERVLRTLRGARAVR